MHQGSWSARRGAGSAFPLIIAIGHPAASAATGRAPWRLFNAALGWPASPNHFGVQPTKGIITIKSQDIMIARRTFPACLTLLIIAAGASAQTPAASDPQATVTAIYARAASGKGETGGGFIIESKAAKAKYLSRSLVALWAKADAKTPKGDVGPVDFDPVTNSQEPDVKSFAVKAETREADKATVAATFTGHRTTHAAAADRTVRYDFVRDQAQWRIDDIRGATDGQPWSIREMLKAALKP
jgi:hypothetical protein